MTYKIRQKLKRTSLIAFFAKQPFGQMSETIIMKYEERFSIEVTIKELKSYLCIEYSYFEGKESNYGYIFILCLAYNFIHYLRLYIPDMSFKDILDVLSAYLLWKKPPKSALLIEGTLKGVCGYNGCEDSNRLNNSILDAIVLSVETTA